MTSETQDLINHVKINHKYLLSVLWVYISIIKSPKEKKLKDQNQMRIEENKEMKEE